MTDFLGFHRAIEMVEKRFGRYTANILLLLIVLATAAICLKTIWEFLVWPIYGVWKTLIEKQTEVSSESTIAIALTFLVVAVVALLAFLVAPLLRNLGRRKIPQITIDQLAIFRSEGISILNERPIQLGGLSKWKEKWQEWRSRVIKTLDENFTMAESLSFQRLGVLGQRTFGNAEDSEHNHKLTMLATELDILQRLIDRYQERQ